MKMDVLDFMKHERHIPALTVLEHLGLDNQKRKEIKTNPGCLASVLEPIGSYGTIPEEHIRAYDAHVKNAPQPAKGVSLVEWLCIRQDHLSALAATANRTGSNKLFDVLLQWRDASEREDIHHAYLHALLDTGFWSSASAEIGALCEDDKWQPTLMALILDEDKNHISHLSRPWMKHQQRAHALKVLYGKYITQKRDHGGWEDKWEPNNTPEGIWQPADGLPKPSV